MSIEGFVCGLKGLSGAEIDKRVSEELASQIDYGSIEGYALGNRRAHIVTTLRQEKLWPPSERRK